jgi:hypothetical protein
VAHIVGGAKLMRVISEGQCDPSDVEGTLRRMESFFLAGFNAPVPEVQHVAH